MTSNQANTFLQHWKLKYGHLPWYRRYEVLIPALLLWPLLAWAVLPAASRPDNIGELLRVFAVFLSFFVLAAVILTDREKPTLFKRCLSISVIVLFGFLFYRHSGTQWDRVGQQFFNLERMEGVWTLYLTGLLVTLRLSLVATILSLLIGFVLGALRSLHNPVMEMFLGVYIDFFRAMPLIVNMVIVFYALPYLGINLSAFWAATTSLVLMNSAYQAEIFRAGIESVPPGQIDAARALGLQPLAIMRFIVFPQTVRIILPPLTNNVVSLVKDTAVAYVITVPELLTQARHAVVWKRNPTPLILSMFIYIATLWPLMYFSRRLETRNRR